MAVGAASLGEGEGDDSSGPDSCPDSDPDSDSGEYDSSEEGAFLLEPPEEGTRFRGLRRGERIIGERFASPGE